LRILRLRSGSIERPQIQDAIELNPVGFEFREESRKVVGARRIDEPATVDRPLEPLSRADHVAGAAAVRERPGAGRAEWASAGEDETVPMAIDGGWGKPAGMPRGNVEPFVDMAETTEAGFARIVLHRRPRQAGFDPMSLPLEWIGRQRHAAKVAD